MHHDQAIADLIAKRRQRRASQAQATEPTNGDRLEPPPDRAKRLAQLSQEAAADQARKETSKQGQPSKGSPGTKGKKRAAQRRAEPEPFLHLDLGSVLVTKAPTAYGGWNKQAGEWRQFETPDGVPKWQFRVETRALGYGGKVRKAESIVNLAWPEKPDFKVGDYVTLDDPQAPVTRRITAHGWEVTSG